jgi:hypothetical protein
MLQDPRRALLTTRVSKFERGRFKIIALITLAVLALLSIVSSRVEVTGDWEYPTMFYGP